MKTNHLNFGYIAIILSMILSSCGPWQYLGPTVTPTPTLTPIPPTSTPKPTQENTKVINPAHFEIPSEEISTLLDYVCVVGEETSVFYSIVNSGDAEGDYEFDILFDGQLIDYDIMIDFMLVDKKIHLPGHSELKDQIVNFTSDFPGEHELQIGDTIFPIICYAASERPDNGYKLMEEPTSGNRYLSLKNKVGVDIVVYVLKNGNVVAARYIRDGGNVRIDWLDDGDYEMIYQRGTYLDSVWISELNRFAQYEAYRSPATCRLGEYMPSSYSYEGCSINITKIDWEVPGSQTSLPEIKK